MDGVDHVVNKEKKAGQAQKDQQALTELADNVENKESKEKLVILDSKGQLDDLVHLDLMVPEEWKVGVEGSNRKSSNSM